MTMTSKDYGTWYGWMMTAPGAPFERRDLPARSPEPGEAVIEVAGGGGCHTDLSFLYHGVKTRGALPLVLGHEISGIVRKVGDGADAALVGRSVVVPAVLPCGECDLCRAGRRTICRRQVMPGNDRNGGFASHVVVPARFICAVPAKVLATHELWELSVVSDAASTPFEAVKRSGLAAGDLAGLVGAGGIGGYGVQIAGAGGGRTICAQREGLAGEGDPQARARRGRENRRTAAPVEDLRDVGDAGGAGDGILAPRLRCFARHRRLHDGPRRDRPARPDGVRRRRAGQLGGGPADLPGVARPAPRRAGRGGAVASER